METATWRGAKCYECEAQTLGGQEATVEGDMQEFAMHDQTDHLYWVGQVVFQIS